MDVFDRDISTSSSLEQEACVGGMAPSLWMMWVVAVMTMVLFVVICSGNGLVIFVFLRAPQLRTMTNCYIIQLAVADFGLGLTMPFHGLAVAFKPELALVNSDVCVLRFATFLMFCASSIFSLVALTHDRYIAITNPLRYHDVMTTNRYVIAASCIWIPAVIVGLIIPCVWHRPFGSCPNCTIPDILERDYLRYIIVPTFTFVSLFMVGLYMRIFSIARRQMKSIANMDVGTPGHSQEFKNKSSLQQEMKLIKVGLTVFAAFYICFLPFCITISIQMYLGIYNNTLLDNARALTSTMISINSCINPIIYTYKLPAFKMELTKLLGIKTNAVTSTEATSMPTVA